ncbi:MAG: dihydropyrimidinase [Deltaproteobacteria bacterium]|nr:dihydropyrimidinase [Deltaproteobacteria bacterium]MBW2121051.1 dihydropyrimidinase [Deltaproteobacteria bacterium]
MDIKITNGTIITATDTYRADIGIAKGKIVQIAETITDEAGEVIDATGAYVFPGAIDMHTHLDMPFMGTSTSDDFETGTIAAAYGGTTCIVDFAIQARGQSLKQTLSTWKAKARGKAVFDYAFHVAISDLTDRILDEIPGAVAEGVTSFKTFLAYKDSLMIDDGALFEILRRCREARALVMVHAENGHIIDRLVKELLAQRKTAPKYHAASRPPTAEAEATGRAIAIAEMAGAPLYIVHLSCSQALEKVREARDRGLPVLAETCPQYLVLSEKNYEEPGFNGAKYVMSPPLRDRSNHGPLWRALASGDLQVISTDHCPFNLKGQKDLGKKDFSLIPNGAPGIENRLCLIFNEGVNKKKIGINRFVELVSTAPARLFGLYPAKGTVAVGSDADLVVFDPRERFTITAKTNHQNVDYTPYEGYRGRGVPRVVLSRGAVLVKEGRFLGRPGRGRYVKRKPFSLM